MRIKPHDLFRVWSADTVAECLDGVPDSIYKSLWNNCLPHQKKANGYGDDFDETCLARTWKYLTDVEKLELNRLAEEREVREYEAEVIRLRTAPISNETEF